LSQYPPPPETLPEESNLTILPHELDELGVRVGSLNTPPPRSSNSGCRSCLLVMSGCGVILIIAAIVLVLVIPGTLVGLFNGVISQFNASVPPPVANVISTQTIVTGIQPLGQLVSVSSQLAVADIEVNVSQGALNACAFGANHVVQGAVEAGIDLTQLTEENIRYDSERDMYVITIPPPQLTSCRVDYIRQYERSFTTCNVDWDEARLIAQYLTLIQFRDTAVEGGILRRAESETRLVLGNFIRLVTGSEVEIVFTDSSLSTDEPDSLYPPSCSPDMPAEWSITPNGEWVRGN